MKKKMTKRINIATDLLNSTYDNKNGIVGLTPARERSHGRFTKFGAPLEKDEYWRFTSPKRFTSLKLQNDQKVSKADFSVDINDKINDKDVNVFFVNGILDQDYLDLNSSHDGLEIFSMRDEVGPDQLWVQRLYGELEAASHEKVSRPLAALNTARASEGLFIRVTESFNKRLVIHYIGEELNSDSFIHNLIKLEENTNLTLIEKGEGSFRINKLTEIDLLTDAHLSHIRYFGKNIFADVLNQVFVRQAKKSYYNQFSLVLNNKFIRNECHVSLEGEEAKVSLSGANLGNESNIQDDTIFIAHLKRDCESRQVFKKVLKENATGVFQGKIYVSSEAQKTDGYQISKGLLIGNDSRFLTKPELEIYADDVICSHGSTSGAIDDDSLFYLTSRGVSKKEAIDMLILAFLDEAVQEIESDELADEVRGLLVTESEPQNE